jgi:predicted transcriptional regulator of viral defense system
MDGSGESRSSAARNSPDPLDGRIADVAFGQHGVVAGWQLVELGLSANAARKRVAAGRLHRVHRGVFAVGHARLTQHGRFMAAVLASGRDAAASHYCSGVLWHLGLGVRRLIDVTTTSGACGRTLAGIRVHRSTTLLPRDVTVRDHIPCTSLARTLLDIAQTATRRDVERACDRADHSRELDMNAIDDVLDRASGRRGATLLRAVLAGHRVGSTLTRNDLEEAFLAICRAIGCPPDGANVWIPFPDGGGAEADFLYRDRTLIAEVDGRDPHTTRKAFTADRRRDQRLMLLGWRVVRFTWQQVTFEPADVAATLRGLLGDS